MTKYAVYFSRCGRASLEDLQIRAPELTPLREKQIAVFGLGCLGGPSAIEFARAGIGGLALLDHDIVDPGMIRRWPLGLSVVGLTKIDALASFIEQNYPFTAVRRIDRYLGLPRTEKASTDMDAVEDALSGADLVYDATAELGIQHYLSDVAQQLSIRYVGVVGSYGGWGGKIISILPGHTRGCWHCYREALADGSIPEPPSDPQGEVQAAGCGDVSFTGAGFDMLTIAMAGVRTAVSALCRGEAGGYPALPGDVQTIALRDDKGQSITPSFQSYSLEKHAKCPLCQSSLLPA